MALQELRLHLQSNLGWRRNGTLLRLLSDQSGYGHHALIETAMRQATFVENVQNGLPAIRFVGGLNKVLRVANMTYGGATGVTVLMILRGTSTDFAVLMEGGGGTGNIFMLYENLPGFPGSFEVRDAGPLEENGGKFNITYATPRRVIATIDRTIGGGALQMRAWLDGVEQTLEQVGANDPSGSFADVPLNLFARDDGSALSWAGDFFEARVYAGIGTDAEIIALDTARAAFWGL